MITFSILLITTLILAVVAAIIVLTGGVLTVTVFGDLIVCGLLIGLLVKLIRRKR